MKIKLLATLVLTILCQAVFAKTVERIIAIVNNEIITLTDVDEYREKLQNGGLVDDALLKMGDPKALLKDQQALVNHLINEKLIDSEVERLGMAVTIERVEQEIRSITSRNGISREQLKSALEEKGVRFSDYQDFIKTSLERQALIEREVSSKIKISDEDIANYYLAHSNASSGQVFEYRLAHILIQDKPRAGKPAKQRMLEVMNKIEGSGSSFETLASQYSEDPQFSEGGLLGTFKVGEMSKSIESAVAGLEAGETSGVIRTPAGYHVIKVLKKSLVSDPKLEKEKPRIQALLYAETFKKQFKKWLDRQREEAFIRINE